jgi:phosphotransferase system enzyme I (PtsI)
MKNQHQTTSDIVLFGTMASPGIAVGKTFLLSQIDLKSLEENTIPVDDVAGEIQRFDDAVRKSIDQVLGLIQSSENEDLGDIAAIFQVHIQLLKDAEFLRTIPALISQSRNNTEYVLANQIRDLEKRFSSLANETARAKVLDVQDVYFRLLRNALNIEHVRSTPLRRMPSSVICVAERLLPSDIALLDLKKIIGIAIENGSTVSHVSIIAKALGIPLLINTPGISSLCRNGSLLVLDADGGKIILRPSPDTVARFEKKVRKEGSALRKCSPVAIQCFTKDSIKIRVEANAGSLQEVNDALENGAEGIGLLRSELFYLSRDKLPSIDEETAFYQSVMALCCAKPLTIRMLDIGADKTLPYLNIPPEENPHLGVRGIRFLLRHQQLMRNHLTCIVRASRTRPVKILLPFVSLLREVDETRKMILDICKKEGVDPGRCSVGIMLEVPAAVLNLGDFFGLADFFSIGTNDLVQYAFAACRENNHLDEYRAASFPLVLRLVESVVDIASKAKKEVTVCGEIASDPEFAASLVGAGIRVLSMQSRVIKAVCASLSRKSLDDCVKMARTVIDGGA